MKQARNQEIQRTNWTQEDMMIRAKKCFKRNKEAPQGLCTNLIFFAFEYNMRKHGILTPYISFKIQP
jgi:hypothetical protein